VSREKPTNFCLSSTERFPMKALTFFGLAAFVLSIAVRMTSAAELKFGDPAPTFELKGSDEKLHNLADYKGKQVVVLAWFPRAFTNGCTAECKSIKENGEAIRKFDVAYFTASTDDVEASPVSKGNKAFAESLNADYPILSDPEGKVAKEYGVLNAQGTMAARVTFYIGKDGKILFIDKVKNAGKQGTDIPAKLKELGVAEKK
jgi:peroxiredoxin Q/BCP